MCIDFKISKQANKNKNRGKYELGTFCEQYGLPPIAPSRRKNKKHSKEKKYHKKYKHKRKGNTQDDYYKKQSPNKFKKKNKFMGKTNKSYNKSNVICHNFGKNGHYKNECKVKEELNQLNISNENKEQILKLMRIENSSNSNEYPGSDIPSYSSGNSSSQSSNSEDSNSPKVTLGCDDNCTNICCSKRLNVLTKNDEEKNIVNRFN